MKSALIGGIALLAALHAGAADTRPAQTVDDLYRQGQLMMPADWKSLNGSTEAAAFIHDDVRKAEDDALAVWVDRELPSPEYFEKERQYLSTRERLLVDCKAGRVGVADTAYYAEHFGAGRMVGVERQGSPDMLAAVPDSIEDQALKIVCAPKPPVATAHKAKKKK